MGRPQAHERSWLTTSDHPICKRQCCSLPHTPESPAITQAHHRLDLAAGRDELQQRHVCVDLAVPLCLHCDSEPIGPLAESASLV